MSQQGYSFHGFKRLGSDKIINFVNIESKYFNLSKRRSNKAKFERLYIDYKDVVAGSLVKKGWGIEDSQGIVQESFTRLLTLDNDKCPKYLKSYVYKIAHNIAIDRIRRAQRSPLIQMNKETEERIFDKELKTNTTGQDLMQTQETLIKINAALDELPERCRQAFWKYRVEGLSYSDISEEMNISESMVRKYVLRAIRHCFQRIEGSE